MKLWRAGSWFCVESADGSAAHLDPLGRQSDLIGNQSEYNTGNEATSAANNKGDGC